MTGEIRETTQISRPIFKINLAQQDSNKDRVIYEPLDKQVEIENGDECILVDLLTVMGDAIYTLLKWSNDDGERKVSYIADFYESEIEATGRLESVEIAWLDKQKSILLLSNSEQ